jgi:hypothetical protein
MREKVKELTSSRPEIKKPTASGSTKKTQKIHISIKAFPGMNKIVIYQVKGGNAEHLKQLENDLRAYFTAKEEYCIEKAMQGKAVR